MYKNHQWLQVHLKKKKKKLSTALLEIKWQLSLFSFMDEWLDWFGKSAVQKQIEDSFQAILQNLSPFLFIKTLRDLFFFAIFFTNLESFTHC